MRRAIHISAVLCPRRGGERDRGDANDEEPR